MRSKHYTWAVTLVLAGAALAYVFGVFLPRMRAISAVRQRVTSKHELIAKAAKLAPTVAHLTGELSATCEYVSREQQRLALPADLPRLYGQISNLVSASGGATGRLEPQAAVTLAQLRKVPLTLSVSGSFESISRILAALEALPACIWVEDLRIDAQRETGGNVKADMLLAIFVDNHDISD